MDEVPIYSQNARFFIMKSIDLESVQISHKHCIWSTTFGPTKKLMEAWKSKHHPQQQIYLIFSVNESGGFQGFARLTGPPQKGLKTHIFSRQQNQSISYEDNFPIKWETSIMLYPFRLLSQFPPNNLNEYKTIMQSKNCQELPFRQGNYLV